MSSQTDFEAEGGGATQADKILKALQGRIGEWVAMPLLARMSGSYNVHSRISDLRKRGFVIHQRCERSPGGVQLSSYKLASGTPCPP